MDRGAAEGVTVAFNGVEAGFEELLLGFLGEFGEGGGGGIGEGAAEAYDGLEGPRFVHDDRRDVLVGLFEGLNALEAAVGKEHGADDLDGRRCGLGRLSGGGGDVNVGFLVVLLPSKQRPGDEAGEKGKERGLRAEMRNDPDAHCSSYW